MKASSRCSAPSDHSSLTDSQFLFGSQFCPENAQSSSSSSQEFNGQSRLQSSLQIPEDVRNEPKFFLKYQTKPHIFGNSEREKTLPFCGIRPGGLLEQFENDKKKAREKEEREVFLSWISKAEEHLNSIQSCLSKIDENIESGMRTLVNGLKDMSKTLQEHLQSQYESLINALTAKCNMEQAMQKTEKMLETRETEIIGLRSGQQLIQECLEVIKCQQSEQHQRVCQLVTFFSDQLKFPEILTEIKKLTPSPRLVLKMKDNTSQTSPSLTQNLCLVTEKQMHYETKEVCKAISVQTSSPLWGKEPCIDSKLVKDTQPWSAGLTGFHSFMDQDVCPDAIPYQTCSKTTPHYKTSKCKKLNKMSSSPEFENKFSEEHLPIIQKSHKMLAATNRKKALAASNLENNYFDSVSRSSQGASYFDNQVTTCSNKENVIESPGVNYIAGKSNNLSKGCIYKRNSRRRKSCAMKKRKSRNVSKYTDKIYKTRSGRKVSEIEKNSSNSRTKTTTINSEDSDAYFVTQPIVQHSVEDKNKNVLVPFPTPTPKQTAVQKKESQESASLSIVKTRKSISKWGCSSSQENYCLPQHNITCERQTWFSPIHFVACNAPSSSIPGTIFEMKQKTKIYSHVYVFDSSDDSE